MNKYKQIFRLRAVHLMAFFIFTYVGVEVTIGGMLSDVHHPYLYDFLIRLRLDRDLRYY